jgi:hypothetical protein
MARKILISSTKNRNLNYLIALHNALINELKSIGYIIAPFRTPKHTQKDDDRIKETWI